MKTETTQQTYQDAVIKTVLWWSEKSFKTSMNQNNGDNSSGGGMAFMLMNMASLKAQEEVTPDKILLFEKKLTELLMSKEDEKRYSITLSVDYHPDRMLSEACNYANLDPSCLPCKTTTWIDENNIAKASYQYRGQLTEI